MQKSLYDSNNLSIVIPTYNPGINFPLIINYLKSLIGKYDVEIIIVDDGSLIQDNLNKISTDDKVKKFRISNSGPLNARLYGVMKASKNYIFFMDDDDYPDKYFFDNYFSIKKNFDILLINLIFDIKSKNIVYNSQEKELNYFKNLCLFGDFGFSSSKIIKKERIIDFINDKTVVWPKFKFNFMEDLFMSLHLYKFDCLVSSNFNCCHYYTSTGNQISTNLNFNSIKSMLFVLKVREEFIEAYFSEHLTEFYSNCLSLIIDEIPFLLKNKFIKYSEKRNALIYLKNDIFYTKISRLKNCNKKSFKKWLIYVIFRIIIL